MLKKVTYSTSFSNFLINNGSRTMELSLSISFVNSQINIVSSREYRLVALEYGWNEDIMKMNIFLKFFVLAQLA